MKNILYDFSSVHKLSSYDKQSIMNISVYLGTVYFSIFKDKKLDYKLTISESFYHGIIELFNIFDTKDHKESYLEPIYVTKNIFDINTKTSKKFLSIGIGKNIEFNKYRPYYLEIINHLYNKSYIFKLSYPTNIHINNNYKLSILLSFRYNKYIFTKKIPKILILSLEYFLSQQRKNKIKQ